MIEVPPKTDAAAEVPTQATLTRVIEAEFGGWTDKDLNVCGVAIRLLREQRAEIDRLRRVEANLRETLRTADKAAEHAHVGYLQAIRVAAEYRNTIKALRTVVDKLTVDPVPTVLMALPPANGTGTGAAPPAATNGVTPAARS